LHARAEYAGRSTTVYLQPGLSGAQRAAALRRLRQEARMGCGPSLPCARLVVACAADWIWRGARQLAAIVRLHPVGTLLPALLITAMAGLFVLASIPALPQPAEQARGVQETATCGRAADLTAAQMLVTEQCGSTAAVPALASRAPLTPAG
jgi:hypothetical protein